jgi:hypothetical protein
MTVVPRIFVAIASTDTWKSETACSVALMMTAFIARGAQTSQERHITLVNEMSCMLPRSRQSLTDRAREWGATHMLTVDADMAFPDDSIECLLARDKDIIGANYIKRQIPPEFVAEGMDMRQCVTDPSKSGVERVRHLGFGLCLIKMEVFEAMRKPYFAFAYLRNTERFTSDDVYFCRQADQMGHESWVDHDLSMRVAHIGSFPYSPHLRASIVDAPAPKIDNTQVPVAQPVEDVAMNFAAE